MNCGHATASGPCKSVTSQASRTTRPRPPGRFRWSSSTRRF